MTQESRKEIKRLRSRALKVAEEVSGLTREELRARIAGNPRLVPLATRVLDEAGMTGQDEILAALGAALGEAVHHPERSDELESILLGIGRIRRAHIELLRALGPDDPVDRRSGSKVTWGQLNVSEQTGIDLENAARLLNDLSTAGFMTTWPALDMQGYTVNRLGLVLLEVLERYT